jgi:hypothetical protein
MPNPEDHLAGRRVSNWQGPVSGCERQFCNRPDAKPEEQRELTRLCVRATMHAGYDEAFIDRVMPGLTITLPMVTGGCVTPCANEVAWFSPAQ